MKLEEKERTLRAKLLKKYQQVGQQQLEEQRERIRSMLQASATKLNSAVHVLSEPKSSDIAVAPQVVVKPSPPGEHEVER